MMVDQANLYTTNDLEVMAIRVIGTADCDHVGVLMPAPATTASTTPSNTTNVFQKNALKFTNVQTSLLPMPHLPVSEGYHWTW